LTEPVPVLKMLALVRGSLDKILSANEFVAVTGTSVVEACGSWPSSKEDYRNFFDYVVK
jgi:hypothetical protein